MAIAVTKTRDLIDLLHQEGKYSAEEAEEFKRLWDENQESRGPQPEGFKKAIRAGLTSAYGDKRFIEMWMALTNKSDEFKKINGGGRGEVKVENKAPTTNDGTASTTKGVIDQICREGQYTAQEAEDLKMIWEELKAYLLQI